MNQGRGSSPCLKAGDSAATEALIDPEQIWAHRRDSIASRSRTVISRAPRSGL